MNFMEIRFKVQQRWRGSMIWQVRQAFRSKPLERCGCATIQVLKTVKLKGFRRCGLHATPSGSSTRPTRVP